MILTDPKQAADGLRSLAQGEPRNADIQAAYLGALYRSGNAWDFEKVLTRAQANGLTTKDLLAYATFKLAIIEESRRQRAGRGLLSPDLMRRIASGL
jgi:hypothetical protein